MMLANTQITVLVRRCTVSPMTTERVNPNDGRKPPNDGRKPPNDGRKPPNDGRKPPNDGRKPPNDGRKPPNDERKPPNDGRKPPNDERKPPTAGKRKSRSAKAGLVFPVGRIHRMLREGAYAKRISSGAPVALASVLEYLTGELLELAGDTAKALKATRITPRHLLLAYRQDGEMSKLFKGVTISGAGVQPHIHEDLLKNKKKGIPSPKKKVVKRKQMPKKKVVRVKDEAAPKSGDEGEEEEELPNKTTKKTKVPKRRANRA